ncbi:hypothetical protein OM076_37930 [Solirubrobacter ginsenosidimutans]|uniref:Uncharacterized protein n=1 Tax=Solirubrobacter ginsenosidimutans TaxID=490573 RepID=A0A9X3N2K3_9ACTN|nr:hypothetical protein [Solirubrobacter ginsenosidimutans]MDA0166106.1 hypothetical protein [Solirubrobacter ginsenosidimutans]
MRRALIAAAGVFLAAAPAAHADTHYGGAAVLKGRGAAPYTSLVRKDDGRIQMRVLIVFACGEEPRVDTVARLSGSTPDGSAFSASGHTRVNGHRLRFSVSGTITPDAVEGKVRFSARGCPGFTRPLSLRVASAPAGAPAMPPPSSLFNGLSAQFAGPVRLPVTIRVARNGRVYGVWTATMKCGPKAVVPMGSSITTTKVKPDGTFLDDTPYTVRYVDGSSERYRIRFEGHFLADGAVGTLRARMQTHRKGHRYYPCDSGTQTWAARM